LWRDRWGGVIFYGESEKEEQKIIQNS